MNPPDLSDRRILDRGQPIVLASTSGPLLGLVDTAVIGRLGSAAELGALAVVAGVPAHGDRLAGSRRDPIDPLRREILKGR